MNIRDELVAFINKAERNYKYKPGTASALRASLKMISSVMTEEELANVDFLADRIDEIGERLNVKYPGKYSADSVVTYKSRVKRIVQDWHSHGQDSNSMANWNPVSTQRKRTDKISKLQPKSLNPESDKPIASDVSDPDLGAPERVQPNAEELKLTLPNGRYVSIQYPSDLTTAESEKIGRVLSSIAELGS